jgi:hypothetical protein
MAIPVELQREGRNEPGRYLKSCGRSSWGSQSNALTPSRLLRLSKNLPHDWKDATSSTQRHSRLISVDEGMTSSVASQLPAGVKPAACISRANTAGGSKFGRGEILEMEAGAIAELHAGRQTIGDFHLLFADGDAVDDGAPIGWRSTKKPQAGWCLPPAWRPSSL